MKVALPGSNDRGREASSGLPGLEIRLPGSKEGLPGLADALPEPENGLPEGAVCLPGCVFACRVRPVFAACFGAASRG